MEGMGARPDEAAILPAPVTLRPRHILWRFGTGNVKKTASC